MGTGYTRNDTANNIADGNIINASDLDGEFDAVQSAFNASTGHTHDGTAGEGAPIETIGPSQDVVATASVLRPKTDNTVDLGTTSLEYKDLFLDGTAHIDTLDVDENASITGTLGVTGTTTLGTANITTGTITTADINGGNIDGTIIGASSAAAITGTTITGTSFVTSGDMTFGDNAKAIFGAGSDLQIYHDGSNSYISDQGTGNLRILAEDFRVVNSANSETMIQANVDADVRLYYDSGVKLATTSTGVDITGEIEADTAHFGTGTGTGTSVADDVVVSGSSSTGLTIHSPDASNSTLAFGSVTDNDYAVVQGYYNSGSPLLRFSIQNSEVAKVTSTGVDVTGVITTDGMTTSADINFGDNDKAIFGAGSDLEIYHDGSHSYIDDVGGTGNIKIRATNLVLQSAIGEDYATFIANGAATLFYDNAPKLATTSTGVDITGTLTSDGLTVDGGATIQNTTGYGTLTLKADTSNSGSGGTPEVRFELGGTQKARLKVDTSDNVKITTGTGAGTTRFNIANNGDISFYDDTGSTPKLTWDASAERLGLGTVSPDFGIHLSTPATNYLRVTNTATGVGSDFGTSSTGTEIINRQSAPIRFHTDSTERMRIDSSGDIQMRGKADVRLTLGSNGTVGNNTSNWIRGDDNQMRFNSISEGYLFETNGSAKMKIDSSGNLLVGTTTTNPQSSSSNSGVQIGDGFVFAGRAGEVAIFNRQQSDGDIAVFRKDGATVGSIGVAQSGDRTYFAGGSYGIASDTSEATIMPCGTTGTGNDGVVNLGKADARFKDAYLSGGVYLGGTGSDNKLDDYETGTFTPVLNSATTTTYTEQTGTYTKVGRLVFIYCELKINSIGDGSAQIISGLPFYSDGAEATFSVSKMQSAAVNFYSIQLRTSGFNIYASLQDGLDGNITTNSNFITSGTQMQFSGVYYTT